MRRSHPRFLLLQARACHYGAAGFIHRHSGFMIETNWRRSAVIDSGYNVAGAAKRQRLGVNIDHSHRPVLAPATLAALPSTRAIPNRDVFSALL